MAISLLASAYKNKEAKMEFKRCPSCKELKELTLDNWYTQKGRRGDGWSGYCKECTRQITNRNRPLVVQVQRFPNTSLLSNVSKSIRKEITTQKHSTYIHSLETGTFKEYKSGRILSYAEWLDELHSKGWTVGKVRFI